jgi:hypothetical protein
MQRLAGFMMSMGLFILLSVWNSTVVGANPPVAGAEKAKSRLEELFLWKVSDS